MKWNHRSVEWNSSLAKIYRRLPPDLKYVLPDLPPHVLHDSTKTEFYTEIPARKQILTIAACEHRECSISRVLRSAFHDQQDILIVGGNGKHLAGAVSPSNKQNAALSSVEAIQMAKVLRKQEEADCTNIFAVSDPNSKHCYDDCLRKCDSGADGIFFQPILSSIGVETLGSFGNANTEFDSTFLIGGLPVIQSVKGLLFWASLLHDFDGAGDPLFQDHVNYFASHTDGFVWAKNQEKLLYDSGSIDGVHYMSLKNTKVLERILF